MKYSLSFLLSLGYCILGNILAVQAQISSDGTTPTNIDIQDNVTEITGGATEGSNLFHSFDEFSIGTGNEAFFDNAEAIDNIFSRVTGGNISNIDGLIRANDANLYLINPAGIQFGSGASLDLGGSFYGSTAESILFPDGVEFSAGDITEPVLTINAPIGLSFRDNPQTIAVNGSELSSANTFLVGGDLEIEGGSINSATINLGGLAGAGTVSFTENNTLSFPDGVAKSDISITSAFLGIFGSTGGGIYLEGNNITFTQATGIFGTGNEFSVRADDTFTLQGNDSGNSLIITQVSPGVPGDAGDINIFAGNAIALKDGSLILSEVARNDDGVGEGNAGEINLTAPTLELTGASLIIGEIKGIGNAQDININVDQVSILENSLIINQVQTEGEGNAGDINIQTGSLTLDGRSLLQASTQGQGDAGNITIDVSGDITSSDGSLILTQVLPGAKGDAGDIHLTADSIFIRNSSNIFTQTETLTNAAEIHIEAKESIKISGIDSGISSQTGGIGNAGNIKINTPELEILNSGQISANNFIIETFDISRDGKLIRNILNEVIEVEVIEVVRNILDEAIEGSGNAGTIEINADSITLEDRGGITALSSAGKGGNIQLKVDRLLFLRNNSEISATAGELDTPGNGGNIDIDADIILAFPNSNSDITANAFEGNGGNINIATEGIFGIDESNRNSLNNDITTSSNTGISGNISIATPDINPVQGTTELPTNIIVPEETPQQACRANSESVAKNGLTILGKGGVVPDPASPLDSLNIYSEGETIATKPIETAEGEIKPARGIEVTESGKIILTAYRTDNSGERVPEINHNCKERA